MAPSITDHDALTSLESKLALVRDRVTALHTRHQTGLYLYGSSGNGKSHTVLSHLDQLEANYKLFNARMTAKGLYRALELDDSFVNLPPVSGHLARDDAR